MSFMNGLQTGSLVVIIIIFVGIAGREIYSRWEESNIIRMHKMKKLKEDLEKEE